MKSRTGEPGKSHAHTHAGRLVHLTEDEGGLFGDAALVHLCPKLVTFAAALAHSRENGIAAVLGGDVVDELLYEHGLADARAAEEPDLAALCVRLQKVDGFDARLQDLHDGALLAERGSGTINAHALGVLRDLPFAVDGLAEDVEHPAQRTLAHGHFDAFAGGFHAHIAGEPFALGEHDAPDVAASYMLRHLHDLAFAVRGDCRERVAQSR